MCELRPGRHRTLRGRWLARPTARIRAEGGEWPQETDARVSCRPPSARLSGGVGPTSVRFAQSGPARIRAPLGVAHPSLSKANIA
jgi:hypothetical protein